MSLPYDAAALVLLAALLHASWNALVKVGGDRLVLVAIANGTGALICLVVVPFVSVPLAASWPFLLASAALHTGYYFFLIRAYQAGDLSHVYPLARGLSPLLVAAAAAAFANEVLNVWAMLGVALACAGIVSLAFEGGPPWRDNPRPLIYAMGTALFIAAYTLADGLGVRRAGGALGYIAWLFVLDGFPIVAIAWYLRRGEMIRGLAREWPKGCASGALQFGAYGLVIWAMSLGPMAAVSALRETSVIFAALIGAFLLRERLAGLRIGAAIMVAAGVIVMRLA